MKANNIKALDYRHQGNTLVLTFRSEEHTSEL